MPEVCEIAITAQYLLSELKNKTIVDMKIVAGRYTRKPFKMHLPLKIINIDSKGKFMWFKLKDDNGKLWYLLNTFGLTGEWSFESGKSDRVVFTISNGEDLYYSDQRNMGTIKVTDDEKVLNKKLDELAPDLLKTEFTDDEFVEYVEEFLKVNKKRANIPIVKVLLKQNKKDGIGSGIGNYLSAEILYRAKISPHRPMGDITKVELKRLSKTIKTVLRSCYLYNKTGYMTKLGDYVDEHYEMVKKGKFPDYHHELGNVKEFEFLVYRQKEDKKGNPVKVSKIEGDRSTYWVPDVQL